MAQIKAKTLRSKEHDPNQSPLDVGDICSASIPPLLAVGVSTSFIIFHVFSELEAGVCRASWKP